MVREQECLTGLFPHHEKSIHKCNSLQKSWRYLLTECLSRNLNKRSRYRLEGKTKQAWLESRCYSSGFLLFHSILKKESNQSLLLYDMWGEKPVSPKGEELRAERRDSSHVCAVDVTQTREDSDPNALNIWAMSWLLVCPTKGLTKNYFCFIEMKAEIPKFTDSTKLLPFKKVNHRRSMEDLGIVITNAGNDTKL